ncbi:MAG: hypothetical protein WC365_10375, partial [Candidatus Babeliales bacterium]
VLVSKGWEEYYPLSPIIKSMKPRIIFSFNVSGTTIGLLSIKPSSFLVVTLHIFHTLGYISLQ